MNILERIRLNFKYKFLPHVKRQWFPYILAGIGYLTFVGMGNLGADLRAYKCEKKSDRPGCYIFWGTSQNSIGIEGTKDRLKVNYLIEGFPKAPHLVTVEVVNEKGELDFLYSEQHAESHRAHLCEGGCQVIYTTFYKIPKTLKSGKYRLIVTFKFKFLLGTRDLKSNQIYFEVKR